ncbi:MAG: hypothetical protein IJ559_09565, partial [Prevotella sp.]|nr:hypothetical protein [Prevotella sp.]
MKDEIIVSCIKGYATRQQRQCDMAMLGFVNHSKVPLRMASFLGFICSGISLLAALVYLVLKLCFWDSF